MWANLTADKLKHLLHLQPVCYTYNPLFVTLTTCYTYKLVVTLIISLLHLNLIIHYTETSLLHLQPLMLHLQPLCLLHLQPLMLHLQPLCLLHLQPLCYTYNLSVTLTSLFFHLQPLCYTYNLFVTLTTSYATLTTSLFVTLTTSLLHLQPLCLLHLQPLCLLHLQPLCLLHLQPLCYTYNLCLLHLQPLCYTYNFFVTLTTTLLHWQPLCLLHFHPLCARHGCTTVGLPGRGMRPASLRGPLQQPSLRQQRHRPGLQARGQLSAERAGGERGAERGVQEQLRALARPGGLWAHGGLGPHAGHVLRTWAHCGFRVKWDRCWGHRRTVGLGVKWDRCWGPNLDVAQPANRTDAVGFGDEGSLTGAEAAWTWARTTDRKDAVGLRVNEGRWVLRPQPGNGQPTEKTL